jgi:hypothetical protein
LKRALAAKLEEDNRRSSNKIQAQSSKKNSSRQEDEVDNSEEDEECEGNFIVDEEEPVVTGMPRRKPSHASQAAFASCSGPSGDAFGSRLNSILREYHQQKGEHNILWDVEKLQNESEQIQMREIAERLQKKCEKAREQEIHALEVRDSDWTAGKVMAIIRRKPSQAAFASCSGDALASGKSGWSGWSGRKMSDDDDIAHWHREI